MIKTIYINDIDSLLKVISQMDYLESIDRYRNNYLFRGMPRVEYELSTSIQRNCGDLRSSLENQLYDNFAKYASIDYPDIGDSVWHKMIIGQHHGLPTRLLDWTPSVLVALHFAVSELNFKNFDKHDCVIWQIDMKEFKDNLPEKYKKVLDERSSNCFNIEQLDSVVTDLKEYDNDMKDKAMVCLEPPCLDQRIVNQYAFFTVVPTSIDDIEDFIDKNTNNSYKYIISKNIRWQVRDILDKMNITERIVYPGLDGTATMIARHYYVKESIRDKK